MSTRRRSQMATTTAAVSQAERSPTASYDDAPRSSQPSTPRASISGAQSPADFKIDREGCKKLAGLPAVEIFVAGIVSNAQDLAHQLATDPRRGLPWQNDVDAQVRAEVFGTNRVKDRKRVSFWALVWEALEDPTVRVLFVSGVLAIALGQVLEAGADSWIEGAAIIAAVLVVTLVTAVQNFQKEQQFRQLNQINEDIKVRVVRGGQERTISTYDLLVGDVLLIDTGDILPADGLLFESSNLRLDESHLTGESEDVLKDWEAAPVVASGSRVLEGLGRCIVLAVGEHSQQGIIAAMVAGVEEGDDDLRAKTQLQQKLDTLATQIGYVGLAAAGLSFAGMAIPFTWNTFVVQRAAWDWAFATDYLHMVIQAITILVVAIPEGLPLAVTIALAFSVKRMLADNNLVRHLSAAETMGCATTICTDKTGTLTTNEMTVRRMWLAGHEFDNLHFLSNPGSSIEGRDPLDLDPRLHGILMHGLALNSTAGLEYGGDNAGKLVKVGNRTECALLELCVALGGSYTRIRAGHDLVRRFPFSSDRKRMSSLTFSPGGSLDGMMCTRLHVKGAAEIILDLCTQQVEPDSSVRRLEEEDKAAILHSVKSSGLRMLALAYRDVLLPFQTEENGDEFSAPQLERDLTLLAIIGIEDPMRQEVPAAIEACHRAGISVRMLTGDNRTTGSSIARQCGILPPGSSVLEATDQGHLLEELRALGPPRPEHTAHLTPQGSVLSSSVLGGKGNLPSSLSLVSQYGSDSDTPDGAEPIPGAGEKWLVMDGPQFRQAVLDGGGRIRQDVFDLLWPRLRVLARCSPADKFTIVQGLQNNPHEIVAVTGDGTNDAPALRLADVGFAMNDGTSIAKDASDILLMDNNFASIVQAVKWGRNVYAGVARFLQFQLTINAVAIATAVGGALALQESPLTAVQMLWVNLIMDSLASLSLATDSPTDELLDLKPYRGDEPLISPLLWRNIIGQGVFQLSIMYSLVQYGDVIFNVPNHSVTGGDPSVHYTLVFNIFVMLQLFNQVNARKIYGEEDVMQGVLSNKLFVYILTAELALQALIVQFGGDAFGTRPLNLAQWAACIGFGALGLFVRKALLMLPGGRPTKDELPAVENGFEKKDN